MSTDILSVFKDAIVSFVFGTWILVVCGAAIRTAKVIQNQSSESHQDRVEPTEPQKPNFVVIARNNSKRVVRPRPRKTSKHPRSSLQLTIADKAEGWEECSQLECFPRFLDLPLELREKIYHLAMADLPTRYFVQPEMKLSALTVSPSTLPALCFANKQMDQEGLSAWIRRTRFVVEGNNLSPLSPVNKFLRAVDGYRHVRMLAFTKINTFGDVYRYIEQSPKRLADKCPGLRSLVIDVDYYVLLDDDFKSLRSKEELEKELIFKPLFQLQSLRHLTVRVLVSEWRKQEIAHTGGLGSLKELVESGFEEAGKSKVVRIEYEVTVVEN